MKHIISGSAEPFSQAAETVAARDYARAVAAMIRGRYSVDDELAILRQKEEKPQEYSEYNAFCELCKEKARSIHFEK